MAKAAKKTTKKAAKKAVKKVVKAPAKKAAKRSTITRIEAGKRMSSAVVHEGRVAPSGRQKKKSPNNKH